MSVQTANDTYEGRLQADGASLDGSGDQFVRFQLERPFLTDNLVKCCCT